MKKKYESEMLEVIHEEMKGMYELGIISDARMREFDEMCFVKESESVFESSSARTVSSARISAKSAG